MMISRVREAVKQVQAVVGLGFVVVEECCNASRKVDRLVVKQDWHRTGTCPAQRGPMAWPDALPVTGVPSIPKPWRVCALSWTRS